MIGAIAGDIIGSIYEGTGLKIKEFDLFGPGCRFTDDTVLTVAVADWILHGGDLVDRLHEYFHRYPHAGFGGWFIDWAARRDRRPYNSWGNGSAMRVSAVGFAGESLDDVLSLAKQSAEVTHNHPNGVRGAQAVAAAIFLARTGREKPEIRQAIESTFRYDLSTPLDEIRETYCFEISCQESVPQSITAFLEAANFEEAVRNAISLGGDADTMACIAGGIAEAYWGVPEDIERQTFALLDEPLAQVVRQFRTRFPHVPQRNA
jgi:ADP-ribosylglycohydrolase